MPSSPQAPPPGWYPDPGGVGLRWWDGTRWTHHVSGRPSPAGEAAGDGGDEGAKKAHARGWRRPNWLLLGTGAVVLIGIAVALAVSLGGSSQAAYAECHRQAEPAFAAMQELTSHLDVGVVESDYSAEVGDVQSVYDRLAAKRLAAACRPVVQALGEAMSAYAEAASAWNECVLGGEEGCGEEAVQERWADADRAIASARRRLSSLRRGGDAVAAAEAEAREVESDAVAKLQARSAQVAMETYATDHDGSYEGATPAKLREVEGSLPPSLEVDEAGIEYFFLSVGSDGGNWFGVGREIGGEVVFKCGKAGRAGCPASGRWG